MNLLALWIAAVLVWHIAEVTQILDDATVAPFYLPGDPVRFTLQTDKAWDEFVGSEIILRGTTGRVRLSVREIDPGRGSVTLSIIIPREFTPGNYQFLSIDGPTGELYRARDKLIVTIRKPREP